MKPDFEVITAMGEDPEIFIELEDDSNDSKGSGDGADDQSSQDEPMMIELKTEAEEASSTTKPLKLEDDPVFDKIKKNLLELDKRKKDIKKDSAVHENFFIFSLCGKSFAIGFKNVAAIKSKYFSSILFKMPEHLAGIFSFQGEILSILRLEKIIGLKGAAEGRILMVIGKKDLKIGLLIDSVDTVCSLKPPVSLIKPGKAKSGADLDLDHVDGILPFENNDILHLDVESLFESNLIWI